jgi:tetratricopeptide (TPR) repeat protein
VWAEKYGGTIDDVFEMQERISRSIVDELRARLTDQEEAGRTTVVTDAETYELYLRAKHMLGQSVMRLPEATALLEEATRRDPRFVPAYLAMAMPLVLAAVFNYIQPKAAWARIQSTADRALSADPRSGAAHELRAAVSIYRDWDWAEAARLYERAIQLEPGAGFDRFLYAFFLTFRGDVDGALQAARAGRRLDPLSFIGFLTEALMLAYTGDFDGALALAVRPSELDPQFPEGYHIEGYLLLGMREHARALLRLERAVELSRRASWPTAKLGCALVGLGRTAEASALRDELTQRADAELTVSPSAVATLHLHLGDHASFYRWMHRGIDERDPWVLALDREFLWDSARDDPAFRELRQRVGLTA